MRKPSVLKQLGITGLLLLFQGYLGFSAIGGQFGIESNKQMQLDILELDARSAGLQVEIDALRHRTALFDATRLDPDIITERARALLNMAHADDILIMTDPRTGLPISGLFEPLPGDQLTGIIEDGID